MARPKDSHILTALRERSRHSAPRVLRARDGWQKMRSVNPARESRPLDAGNPMSDAMFHRVSAFALAVVMLFGAWLRIDAVPRRYAPDKDSGGDVARYYTSTAESLVAGRGFQNSYDNNFIPPPMQALFLAGIN